MRLRSTEARALAERQWHPASDLASECASSNFDHVEYESILEADFIEMRRTDAGSTEKSQEYILREAAGPGLSTNSSIGNGSRLRIAIAPM